MANYRLDLLVCAGTGCVSNNSFKVKTALEKELQQHGLQDEIRVITTGLMSSRLVIWGSPFW